MITSQYLLITYGDTHVSLTDREGGVPADELVCYILYQSSDGNACSVVK
jgi:hypothetical protein